MTDLGPHDGLYELLVTTDIDDRIKRAVDKKIEIREVDKADQPHVLARHIYETAVRSLDSIRDPERRVAAANDLINRLGDIDEILNPPTQLRRISPRLPSSPASMASRSFRLPDHHRPRGTDVDHGLHEVSDLLTSASIVQEMRSHGDTHARHQRCR